MHNPTGCERFMGTVFEILSGTSAEIASAIFYCSDSLQGKKTLLLRTGNVTGDDNDKKLVNGIIAAAEVVNGKRN